MNNNKVHEGHANELYCPAVCTASMISTCNNYIVYIQGIHYLLLCVTRLTSPACNIFRLLIIITIRLFVCIYLTAS